MANFPTSAPALSTSYLDATTSATNHPNAHNTVNDEVDAIGNTLLGTVAGTLSFKQQDKGGQVFNVKAYGAVGNGTTNDSTAIGSAASAAVAAGNGIVYFPMATYAIENIPVYSNITYDLGGSTLKLRNSATADSDVFKGTSFDTLIGGNTTGGVYRWTIRNGVIDGNRANNANGRHGIAVYGVGTMRNLIIHDCKGNGIWAEWSTTSTQLAYIGGAPGVALGDQTMRYIDLEIYDCEMRVPVVGFDVTIPGGITGVTNVTNPTVTTSQYHLLRAGQTITIAGVVGATGVNGTKTVATTPTATTFTITQAAPGAYTSGGTITYAPKAALLHKGSDSPHFRALEIWQSAPGFIPGSRGVLWGAGGINGDNLHVYQNFTTGVDIASTSNSSLFRGVYVGGHDQGILVRQNYVTLDNWMINGSATNSIGLDHQAAGGTCFYTNGRFNALTSGSICYRIWNTSQYFMTAMGVGDGGSNTSILYTAPNGTTGHHGWLYNGGAGVNATPASLINFTT